MRQGDEIPEWTRWDKKDYQENLVGYEVIDFSSRAATREDSARAESNGNGKGKGKGKEKQV